MQNRYVYKQCSFDVFFLNMGKEIHIMVKNISRSHHAKFFLVNSVHMAVTIFENWCRPAVSGPLALNRWPVQGLEPKQEGHKRCP